MAVSGNSSSDRSAAGARPRFTSRRRPGAWTDAVVVLAYDKWTEQFAADPAVVGRQSASAASSSPSSAWRRQTSPACISSFRRHSSFQSPCRRSSQALRPTSFQNGERPHLEVRGRQAWRLARAGTSRKRAIARATRADLSGHQPQYGLLVRTALTRGSRSAVRRPGSA